MNSDQNYTYSKLEKKFARYTKKPLKQIILKLQNLGEVSCIISNQWISSRRAFPESLSELIEVIMVMFLSEKAPFSQNVDIPANELNHALSLSLFKEIQLIIHERQSFLDTGM